MEGFPGSCDFDRFHPEPGNIFIRSVVPAFHAAVTVWALCWDGFPEVEADLLCESAFLDVSAACLYFDDHAALGWPVCFHAERAVGQFHPTPPRFHRVPKVRHDLVPSSLGLEHVQSIFLHGVGNFGRNNTSLVGVSEHALSEDRQVRVSVRSLEHTVSRSERRAYSRTVGDP